MDTPAVFWIAFHVVVLAILAFDLLLFHRKARPVTFLEALGGCILWVLVSMGVGAFIWQQKGSEMALDFLAGYLVEYSLSVDNIFIFVILLSYFKVPPALQHRVLFWGVLGALIMRGIMIGIGVALIERFHWILYLFGIFLVFTAIKMLLQKEGDEVDPNQSTILRLFCKLMPITNGFRDKKFFIHEQGKWMATPLALVLIMVETTDLIFALDSIPAIFSITQDPFVVYTSNICAILGLRSLYFVLAKMVHGFIFLKTGLALVLAFIGIKMLIKDWYEIPTPAALIVVASILATSILTSIVVKRWMERHTEKTKHSESIGSNK